jgi:hypothetical protein
MWELCFVSTVRLEHSPLDHADLDLEDAAKTFSGRLLRLRDAGPRLLHRTPSTRSGERSAFVRWHEPDDARVLVAEGDVAMDEIADHGPRQASRP